jgi:uncharacterized protein (DUF2147 family)
MGNVSVTHLVAVVGLCLLPAGLTAQDPAGEAGAVLGTWLTTDGKAHIEIYRCEDFYCGKIVWLSEPLENGRPKLDKENPDQSLRERPILGLVLMRDFSYDGDGEWTGGNVYDPESGDEYKGKLTLRDSTTLDLRGYILLPLFGRTEEWTRVVKGQP